MAKYKLMTTRNFVATMRLAGIAQLDIMFQGGGDSGQITEICCYDENVNPINFDLESTSQKRKETYRSIIENWFNDFMEQNTSVNWTNNAGGQGNVEINTDRKNTSIEVVIDSNKPDYESLSFDADEIKWGLV